MRKISISRRAAVLAAATVAACGAASVLTAPAAQAETYIHCTSAGVYEEFPTWGFTGMQCDPAQGDGSGPYTYDIDTLSSYRLPGTVTTDSPGYYNGPVSGLIDPTNTAANKGGLGGMQFNHVTMVCEDAAGTHCYSSVADNY